MTRARRGAWMLGAWCALGAGVTARAQETPASRWTISAEPAVYYVAPAGKLRMPNPGGGSSGQVKLLDLNLDNPRLSPFAEVNLRHEPWGATVRAFSFGSEDRASSMTQGVQLGTISLAPGDVLHSSLDFASAEIEGSYRFWTYAASARESGGYRVRANLDAVGGLRLIDERWEIGRVAGGPAASISQHETYLEPLVGFKFSMVFYEQASVDLVTTAGVWPGGTTTQSWDIILGFSWRPQNNVGVQIGYRQLVNGFDTHDHEDFKFEGSMAGLYFGVTLAF